MPNLFRTIIYVKILRLYSEFLIFLLVEKMRFFFLLKKLNVLISSIDFGKLFHLVTPLYYTEYFWYFVRAWIL